MADIVIRGMEMPLFKTELIVFTSGVVQVYDSRENYLGKSQAVPLPEGHGRLIDADALLNSNGVGTQIAGWGKMFHETTIAYAPTIVPAEEGADDGT